MYLKMIQNRFYSLSSAPTKACRTSKESSWPKDQFETKEKPLGAAETEKRSKNRRRKWRTIISDGGFCLVSRFLLHLDVSPWSQIDP